MSKRLGLCIEITAPGRTAFCLVFTEELAPPAEKLEAPASAKDTSLDFLADLPSLKAVSLKMSGAEFLDIVTQQKLGYEREINGGQTVYHIHAQKGTVVYFGFREARCTGIQRLRD